MALPLQSCSCHTFASGLPCWTLVQAWPLQRQKRVLEPGWLLARSSKKIRGREGGIRKGADCSCQKVCQVQHRSQHPQGERVTSTGRELGCLCLFFYTTAFTECVNESFSSAGRSTTFSFLPTALLRWLESECQGRPFPPCCFPIWLLMGQRSPACALSRTRVLPTIPYRQVPPGHSLFGVEPGVTVIVQASANTHEYRPRMNDDDAGLRRLEGPLHRLQHVRLRTKHATRRRQGQRSIATRGCKCCSSCCNFRSLQHPPDEPPKHFEPSQH